MIRSFLRSPTKRRVLCGARRRSLCWTSGPRFSVPTRLLKMTTPKHVRYTTTNEKISFTHPIPQRKTSTKPLATAKTSWISEKTDSQMHLSVSCHAFSSFSFMPSVRFKVPREIPPQAAEISVEFVAVSSPNQRLPFSRDSSVYLSTLQLYLV